MFTRQKKADVIIPTYKPDETVVMLVKRLLKQTYPIHEIHLINTETGVFPEELYCLEKVRVTHIPKTKFDHGGTRHFGAETSGADFLIYMTQDAVPVDERMIEKLLQPFEDETVAIAYGRQMPAADCKFIERYTRSFNYPEKGFVKSAADLKQMGIKTYFCSDVCAAYRKSVYEELGGFERRAIFNEDMIMAARVIQTGYRVAYAAEARVIHSHNYGWIQQFQRNFDLAVSQSDHPEIFEAVKSETEGIRLVKDTAKYLINRGRPWLIPSLVITSGFKYLGYRCGRNYKKLPRWMIRRCTMNPGYWLTVTDVKED
ncbi:glycosyltransferase family 2 protein [Mediterraneibacter agrestimuris]|uniref:glycosyltransferase family 2 protein n=1 Tax=Mediterraneibacter agrestimuris TaxID=2941333 RepID=UPI00203DAA14|nr:glycosyltransferase family 2 protein [Mediterraneibacter agrestimuris]